MTITQPRAPFHVVPRGWAGPGLLAMLLFDKYGQHQRLTRQAERFAREGVPLSLSTLADQVGAATFALMPLYRRIEAHVLAADRLHGDDTTCRSSPRARPISAGCGSMSATTGPSAAPIRPPRCSTIRATAVANICAVRVRMVSERPQESLKRQIEQGCGSSADAIVREWLERVRFKVFEQKAN